MIGTPSLPGPDFAERLTILIDLLPGILYLTLGGYLIGRLFRRIVG